MRGASVFCVILYDGSSGRRREETRPGYRPAVVRQRGRLEKNLGAATSRFIPLWRDTNLVAGGAHVHAVLLSHEELAVTLPGDDFVYLGTAHGCQYFAVQMPADAEPVPAWLQRGAFKDLRQIGGQLEDFDAALLAYARGMCFWHAQHRYCGVCGSPTEVRRAGHLRVCRNPECGKSHFPRTDPAIIVLAHDGDRCLLGRKPEWPPGRPHIQSQAWAIPAQPT